MNQTPAESGSRILSGDYSAALKERILSIIRTAEEFEKSGFPLMPYVAAWNDDDKIIWYEYAGNSFTELLKTNTTELSRIFRKSILDQRHYHYSDLPDSPVEEEIITRNQLSGKRIDLREDVQQKRKVEAVYKVALSGNRTIWLKDQGRVEIHPDDRISISIGCLTDVTKEMEQKELLRIIGYFDDLTGLPQRKFMERLLEVKMGELDRGHIEDFSVLMIDIDHFKQVNDTYGHQAGDFILREMASLMAATKRKNEEIGRYGGEEFYAVCQGTTTSAVDLAERLRSLIKDHLFCHNGQEIHITISAGAASAGELPEVNMDELIGLADKRLYRAKHKGRDRVVGQ
ncbi:MAG: GGDEF domain-containing protein [Thermodesulfobacteriota bacterium]